MAYIHLKQLHATTNAAATDLHEMKRQYAMAVRDGNHLAILDLAHNVTRLETAYTMLLELVEDMEKKS